MKIPNFNTHEGAILYSNTVGTKISPKVASFLSEAAVTWLREHPARDVLDIGCGPGTLSLPLAQGYPNLSVLGIDASVAMVEEAIKKAQASGITNATFRELDAAKLDDLTGRAFDLALSNLAFPFFNQPQKSMKMVSGLLKEGGHTAFTVPGKRTWEEFFAVAKGVMGSMVDFARPFLVKFAQAEDLPNAMQGANLNDVEVNSFLVPFTFANGTEVLNFFSELFHLLDYAPPKARDGIIQAIDRDFPNGFTMHYEAVLVQGSK